MKKHLALFPVLVLLLSACGGEKGGREKNPTAPEVPVTPAFLVDPSWGYYDDGNGERIDLTFCDDGEFYYCCECGEPVEDYDIYATYTYDEEKNEVQLFGYDGEFMRVPILSCTDTELVLKLKGQEVRFTDLGEEE